jgi:hypothetical protein
MNRFGFLVALLAGAAWAQDGHVTLAPTPLQLPARIGPMTMDTAPHQYDDPRLGVSYQYRGPGVSLTVYVYDAGVENLADGPDTIPACYEFESAKHGLSNVSYEDVRLVSEQMVRLLPPDDTLFMREAMFELLRGERRVISYVWVTGVAKHFLKLRFSSDESLRPEMPEARRAILAAVGEAIKPYLAPADPAAETRSTSIMVNGSMLGGSSSDATSGFMYTMILSALAEETPQMLPVCGGEVAPGFETEVSLFRSVFVEEAMGTKSKFGKRVAQIESAGLLEEFVWTERHRESWGEAPPEGLELDRYAAWKKKHLKRLKLPGFGSVVVNHPRALPVETLASP